MALLTSTSVFHCVYLNATFYDISLELKGTLYLLMCGPLLQYKVETYIL